MNVTVNAAGGNHQVFAGNNFRRCSNYELRINTFHCVGIPGLPYLDDASVLNAYVTLHDSPVIQDDCVGDYQVKCPMLAFSNRCAALAHTVADYFSSAESDFIAVSREIFFYLDD